MKKKVIIIFIVIIVVSVTGFFVIKYVIEKNINKTIVTDEKKS